ncbi:MAG: hypothetical protein ACR2RD_12215 [Woeseiaceae bacterium]
MAKRRCGALEQTVNQAPYSKASNGESERHVSKANESGHITK